MCSNNCNCGGYNNFSILTANGGIGTSTGDSRKIRIGNDIKLDVTIQELNGMDIINIKAIKCLIVNTTPMLTDHVGNAYEIHRCGLPHYHCLPSHCHGVCGWKHYDGFGMYPCMHKNWNLCPHYDYFYRNPYGRSCLKCINPGHKPFEFIAPVKALQDRNKVRVFFPASAQMLCGLYSLTFIIELYEPGYHSNDLRTITVDYNNIFELVPNMEGASGDITIDIDKQIGLNSYDKYMFGNTNCGCNCECSDAHQWNPENQGALNNITIIQNPQNGGGVRVGEIGVFNATGNVTMSDVDWELTDTGHATIAKAYGTNVQIYGNRISNTVDGYNNVILSAMKDGIIGTTTVKVHNYATDVNIGGYGSIITLAPGQQILSTVYVTQEDGTKVSICERGGCCQAIEAGTAEITETPDGPCLKLAWGEDAKTGANCVWTYDDTDGNDATSSIDDNNTSAVSGTKCCRENKILLQNINGSKNTRTATVKLTSNMKSSNGLPITKTIIVKCLGSDSAGSPELDDERERENDIYITSGAYSSDDNRITFNYHGDHSPIDVELTGIGEAADPVYWYTDN